MFDRHSTTHFHVLFGDRLCLRDLPPNLALVLMLYAIKIRERNFIWEFFVPTGEGTILKINVFGR